MSVKEVLDAIRQAIAEFEGDEKELYEELDAEAAGWRMRLNEIEDESEDQE